jgi:hypothetical protein
MGLFEDRFSVLPGHPVRAEFSAAPHRARRTTLLRTAAGAAVVVVLLAVVLFLPRLLLDWGLVSGQSGDRARAVNDIRGSLLEALGGLVVVLGALLIWRQLQLIRRRDLGSGGDIAGEPDDSGRPTVEHSPLRRRGARAEGPGLTFPVSRPSAQTDLDSMNEQSSMGSSELNTRPDLAAYCDTGNQPVKTLATVSSRCSVRDRSATAEDRESSGDQAELLPDLVDSVVDVGIFWVPSPQPVETILPSAENQRGRIVIERVVTHTPDPDWPTHGSPGGEQDDDDLVTQRLQDAVSGWMTGELIESPWQRTTEVWVTPVCDGVASLAEGLGDLQQHWHDIIVGAPVRQLGPQFGLEPASAGVLAAIASALPLPGDTTVKEMKRVIQFVGIVSGTALGHPLLVNAFVKSLLHDIVAEVVATKIKDFLGEMCEPAGPTKSTLVREPLVQKLVPPQSNRHRSRNRCRWSHQSQWCPTRN